MRAVAVLLVLIYHAGAPFIDGGYVGVDVFFVLSGFLITNHLLAELHSTGRIRFAAFYARRARRLLPASFTVVIVTTLVVALFAPPRLAQTIFVDAAAALAFVPNFLFAYRGTDYLAEGSTSPLLHYWSLGVEEQFYVLWPAILVVIWLALKRSPHRLAWVVGLLVVLSFVLSVVTTNVSEPWGYFSPWTRAWELGAGAMVAVLALHERAWPTRLAAIATWLGLGAVIASAFWFDESTLFPGYAALLPVLGTVAIIVFASSSRGPGVGLLLNTRVPGFFGRISYSLYLVHWPLLTLPALLDPAGTPISGAVAAVLAALSIPLAWALHRLVEMPVLNGRVVRAASPRRVLSVAAGGLVASMLVVAASSAAVAAKPQFVDQSVDAPEVTQDGGEATPVAEPAFTGFVPSNLEPALADAASDLPVIYADGCHLDVGQDTPADCVYGDVNAARSIVLFGDSHAAQWFPALERFAEEQSYRLVTHTKSSCPPFDVTIVNEGVDDTGCSIWRDRVVQQLQSEQPDLIVMAGFAHYAEFGTPGLTSEQWRAGAQSVVSELSTHSDVVVIEDTPRFPRTPALCLSANIDSANSCAISPDDAFNVSLARAQREGVETGGGDTVSMNDYLCSATQCGPILGNLLVYRDQHHIATRIALLLEPALTEALLETTAR